MSPDDTWLSLNKYHKLQKLSLFRRKRNCDSGKELRSGSWKMGRTWMDGEKEEFKIRIQESKMWSWPHEEMSRSRAKLFECESAHQSAEAKFQPLAKGKPLIQGKKKKIHHPKWGHESSQVSARICIPLFMRVKKEKHPKMISDPCHRPKFHVNSNYLSAKSLIRASSQFFRE